MTEQFTALLLYGAATIGFLTCFWNARKLTGDADRDAPLKRRLRFVAGGSFALLAAALLVPMLLRPNVRWS
jgi:hypothetical protein